MIKLSMYLEKQCPQCGYGKLNVIKELESSKFKCECEKCKSKIIVDTITPETIIDILGA